MHKHKTPKRFYNPKLQSLRVRQGCTPSTALLLFASCEAVDLPVYSAYKEYIRRHHPEFASTMLPAAAALAIGKHEYNYYMSFSRDYDESSWISTCLEFALEEEGMPDELRRLVEAIRYVGTSHRYKGIVRKAMRNPRGRPMKELMSILAIKAGLETQETRKAIKSARSFEPSAGPINRIEGRGWLPIEEVKMKLDDYSPYRGNAFIPAYAGVQPYPSRAALGRLGYKAFKKKANMLKTALLMDFSGSMYSYVVDVAERIFANPRFDAVVYASTTSWGYYCVLVKDGRMLGSLRADEDTRRRAIEDIYDRIGYDNRADGTVLRWFANEYRHVRNKKWVTDLGVSAPGWSFEASVEDCLNVCRQAGIEVIDVKDMDPEESVRKVLR